VPNTCRLVARMENPAAKFANAISPRLDLVDLTLRFYNQWMTD
jgi:hypothetical protein